MYFVPIEDFAANAMIYLLSEYPEQAKISMAQLNKYIEAVRNILTEQGKDALILDYGPYLDNMNQKGLFHMDNLYIIPDTESPQDIIDAYYCNIPVDILDAMIKAEPILMSNPV